MGRLTPDDVSNLAIVWEMGFHADHAFSAARLLVQALGRVLGMLISIVYTHIFPHSFVSSQLLLDTCMFCLVPYTCR